MEKYTPEEENHPTSSLKIYIPYPLPDSLEAEVFRAASKPGYNGPEPIAVGDANYMHDLQIVRDALGRVGLNMPEPEPVEINDDRFFVVTIPLVRDSIAEQVQNALAGFRVEKH